MYSLRTGNCITGSDLSLGTSSPWPDSVEVVPCTQLHEGEVFFAGNAWPQSIAYPGDNKINNQAQARCDAAFLTYDGAASSNSAFSYDYTNPDDTTWPQGDRFLLCVAYDPNSGYQGGAVNYSIRGTDF
jgi:hypothetical protein